MFFVLIPGQEKQVNESLDSMGTLYQSLPSDMAETFVASERLRNLEVE